MPKIFICYRRDDSTHQAGRIFDHLADHFGKHELFKDVDSIPLGLDFRRVLSEKVAHCDVLLAIIGDAWVSTTDAKGERRLDDPNDFVRIEVESALQRNIAVIPVLVGRASVPQPGDLPESLSQLAFRQGLAVRADPDFHNDVDRLIRGIKEVHDELAPAVAHSRAAAARPDPHTDSSQSPPAVRPPSPMIRFSCPDCRQRLQAKLELAGKEVRCKCGKGIMVPGGPVGQPIASPAQGAPSASRRQRHDEPRPEQPRPEPRGRFGTVKRLVQLGLALSLTGGLVGDFLRPIEAFNFYALVVSAGVAGILLIFSLRGVATARACLFFVCLAGGFGGWWALAGFEQGHPKGCIAAHSRYAEKIQSLLIEQITAPRTLGTVDPPLPLDGAASPPAASAPAAAPTDTSPHAAASPPAADRPVYGGQVLGPKVQEKLALSDDQKKQVEEIQKQVDGELGKLLTQEQQKQLTDGPNHQNPGGQEPKQEDLTPKKDDLAETTKALTNVASAMSDVTVALEAMVGTPWILSPSAQIWLKLTDEQKKTLGDLQTEVDGKLAKILTEDQQKQLRGMR
jgi:hypothetical protein